MPTVLEGPRGVDVFLWARYPCEPLKVFPVSSGSDRGGEGVGPVGEGAHLSSANKLHVRQSRPDAGL